MLEHDLQDWLTLNFLPGFGGTRIKRLLAEFNSPAEILCAGPDRLTKIDGIGPKLIQNLTDRDVIAKAKDSAVRELEEISRHGVSVVSFNDPGYPLSLKNISDPPVLLYCRGHMECLGQPAVALVGSRSATSYGRRVSFSLGRDLAHHGLIVISGMAMGIDGEAHAGALAGGGSAIGVLGCGVDIVYPSRHRELFAKVEAQGVLVSEYPLGTMPDAFRFPERNRIISGLALGVVVVEATLKSGSLITAGLALEQGREVFAVPGRVDSAKSQGAHRLLQQGAKLVHRVEDILEELHWSHMMHSEQQPGEKNSGQFEVMSEDEHHLFTFLDTYPLNIDELVHLTGYDTAVLADLLVRLELRGVVRQLPGQQYELCREKNETGDSCRRPAE